MTVTCDAPCRFYIALIVQITFTKHILLQNIFVIYERKEKTNKISLQYLKRFFWTPITINGEHMETFALFSSNLGFEKISQTLLRFAKKLKSAVRSEVIVK